MIAGLPYDAEVEYLRNTGLTQWIDTGVVFSGALRIVTRFTPRQSVNDKWALASWDTYARIYAIYQYSSGYYGGGYGSYVSNLSPMTVGETVDLEIEYTDTKQIIRKNGVQVATVDKLWNFGTVTRSLWLFNLNDGSNGSKGFLCDFGRVQMFVGDTPVRDFIPVRFTNSNGQSEGAMYDRVSRKLFRNAGTGSFTIGPDVATPVMGLHVFKSPAIAL